MSDSRISRLNRERSRFIFRRALSWTEEEQDEISTLAQGIPVALRSQGLLILTARLADSEKTGINYIFFRMLFEWIKQAMPLSDFPRPRASVPDEFLEELLDMEQPVYFAYQAEAMAFAEQAKLILKAVKNGKGGA